MTASIYWWRKPKDPTPLEVATREFVEAQHALLTAQSDAERGNATVTMLEGRIARLRAVMEELRSEPVMALGTLRVQHA